ncbi:MAG: sugar phosphate isomerase/epimerase family protein, partial [Verrucomicrobiota bacterium]
ADHHQPFKISLAQWSMHRALRSGELDNLDWAKHTKENFGIEALEYVNQFFCVGDRRKDKFGLQPKPADYIAEMKKRTDDLGMTNVLVMCDGVGDLGNPDDERRSNAIQGHYAWCDTANQLGCHAIRVNARSSNTLSAEEQKNLCVDGLRRLSEHAKTVGLSVIVENHGGLSSDGAWLASVMKEVGLENCGTLPDFGNFYLVKNRGNAEAYQKAKELYPDRNVDEDEKGLAYDRYQGIKDLMPYAKGVSAKSHDFDEDGNEVHTDFVQAMKIVRDSGYKGYVGVEYEGSAIGEVEGIQKTKDLLDRVIQATA